MQMRGGRLKKKEKKKKEILKDCAAKSLRSVFIWFESPVVIGVSCSYRGQEQDRPGQESRDRVTGNGRAEYNI